MPWLDNLPELRKPFGRDELRAASAGVQIESVVYVQADTTPAYGLVEARWAAAEADADPRIAAIVAWAPVEDGSIVRTYLDALTRVSPLIKGVRRLIQSEPDPMFCLQADFLTALRILPEYDLSFDICVRHDQLATAARMVRACPETRFILDHLGKPPVRRGMLDPWRQHIADLAQLPNVVCKLSGLVTEADHTSWNAADLAPYIAHSLAVFGEDRVLFGSDWPVVTLASSYQRWVETLTEHTLTLSSQAQSKLWHTNSRSAYRIRP